MTVDPIQRIRRVFTTLFVLSVVGILSAGGEETTGESLGDSENAPESVGEEFSELIENSPFLRPLDLSRSLVLTGVAQFDGAPFAILLDRETDESHLVTRSRNQQGWQLLDIEGDLENMASVTARIEVAGGGIFSIRYDPKQLRPDSGGIPRVKIPADQAKRIAYEARNFRKGLSSDGFPREVPRELADKFGKLSEAQRGQIIYQMDQHRRKGVGGEERQKIFTGMVNRAVGGRR